MFADSRAARIHHLRVRGANLDTLLTPLRLARLLNDVEMRPSGLPPSAILCVRQLRDPLPRSLRLNGHTARPPQRWEQALAASLDDSARHAARPLLQTVPANANAVLFTDRAEMLACLASDWANGMLAYRWWWRSLLQDHDVKRTVQSAWQDTPQYVPSALAHLAAKGEAVIVVRRMDEAAVAALLNSVLAVFNLPDLAVMIQESLTGEIPPLAAPASPRAGDAYMRPAEPAVRAEPQGDSVRATTNRAPWADHVPESLDASLVLSSRLLLGIGLSLVRDPTRVRTVSFALQTRHWLQHEAAQKIEIAPDQPERSTYVAGTTAHSATLPEVGEPGVPASTQGTATAEDLPAAGQQTAMGHTPAEAAIPVENVVTPGITPVESELAQSTESSAPESAAASGIPIETALGGLFYLLNLAVYVGWYADYTMPWKQELELNIWDFVTLIGMELLGDTPPDPIWPLLAELAGRDPDTLPGTGFTPPDAWRVDPRWLDAFPETDMRIGLSDRLRVYHPAGFLLVDVPLAGQPVSRLLDEIRSIYSDNLVTMPINDEPTPNATPLRRWLDWLTPYLQARLRRALDLGQAEDPAPILCRHQARVFVTPTHVDVLFSLDTLPIEIRLAGLDRNPGWLPAAGRTITFHFESGGA
jgi:hypothetical protein